MTPQNKKLLRDVEKADRRRAEIEEQDAEFARKRLLRRAQEDLADSEDDGSD